MLSQNFLGSFRWFWWWGWTHWREYALIWLIIVEGFILDQERDFSITHHTCFSWFSSVLSFIILTLTLKWQLFSIPSDNVTLYGNRCHNMGLTDAWSQKHEAAKCPITVSRLKTWMPIFCCSDCIPSCEGNILCCPNKPAKKKSKFKKPNCAVVLHLKIRILV